MNTQEVEIVDEEVEAIRRICAYLKKIDDLPVGIKQDMGTVNVWATNIIIGDDVPF